MSETPLLLRWRERPTIWQRIQSRWQNFWQRLHTPRLIIQPPLQPARQKPFPQRPHHRRRQAVFAALATAPAEATIRELMAHVQAMTGTGCSRKLIIAWRQERKSDTATQGQADAGSKTKAATGRRWRAVQLRLFLLLCVGMSACATTPPIAPPATQREVTISPAPTATPDISNFQSPISNPNSPRLLRIKLTINAPHELRIQQGDAVNAGDVVSNRQQARERLLVQQRALQSAQQHLQQQRQLADASLAQLNSLGTEPPAITFAAERAAIQHAETEAIAAQRTVATQQARLSVVRGQLSVVSPTASTVFTDDQSLQAQEHLTTDNEQLTLEKLRIIQQHEESKLTQVSDKQLLAHSDIELHQAKLVSAKELRAWQGQTHRVELTRQILSVRHQQQQIELELARLTAQLAELNLQIANFTEIRAPFAGIIKRIEWEEMNNENISVLVYLSLGSR
jgi:hypothetical protein